MIDVISVWGQEFARGWSILQWDHLVGTECQVAKNKAWLQLRDQKKKSPKEAMHEDP